MTSKLRLLVPLLLCLSMPPAYMLAESDQFDDEFANFDLGDEPLRSNCSLASQLADQFLQVASACGLLNILTTEFFKHTNVQAERNLLDQPLFQNEYDFLRSPARDSSLKVNGHFFYNQISRNYFTANSKCLGSYLAIVNSPFTQAINTALNNIRTNEDCYNFFTGQLGIDPQEFNIDVEDITGLFGNMTTQERKAGLFLEVMKNHWNLDFYLKIPIYYLENNFFLTDQEITAIEEAAFFPPTTEEQDRQFQQQFLIADQFGLGDTRFSIGREMWANYNRSHLVYMGIFTSIPTAAAVSRGIYGSSFSKKCPIKPTFDICEILNMNLSATNLEEVLKHNAGILGEDFLERLSAMVIQKSLGYSGHWGLGGFIEPLFILRDDLSFQMRGSVEYLFPKKEYRFLTKNFDEVAFNNIDFATSDLTQAATNLELVNQRLLDMFFPISFKTAVQPALILEATGKFLYQLNRFGAMLGADIWFQGKERLGFPSKTVNFNTAIAHGHHAYQAKVFGGISYVVPGHSAELTLGLNADVTFASKGIGKEYTIAAYASMYW